MANDKAKHIIVFAVMGSDLNIYVNIENTNIPETNDRNLLGHN
jgi:hypothetical protein